MKVLMIDDNFTQSILKLFKIDQEGLLDCNINISQDAPVIVTVTYCVNENDIDGELEDKEFLLVSTDDDDESLFLSSDDETD